MLYVLALLAIARLARLVTADTITARPRVWLQTRLPGKLAYLIGCPWCASPYVGAPVAAAVVWWPENRAVWFVLLVLAGSYVAGFLAAYDSGVVVDVVLPADQGDDE